MALNIPGLVKENVNGDITVTVAMKNSQRWDSLGSVALEVFYLHVLVLFKQ